MKYLEELEAKSIYIIREAYRHYKNRIAALVSWGKDSTTMLYLIKKSFFGKIPMPVLHIDTGYKLKEIYEFRDELAKKWNFKLIIARNEKAIRNGMNPRKGRFECCTALKTEALKQAIIKYKLKALLVGIRRDEHAVRAKERYFSQREEFTWNYLNQPPELWEQFNVTQDETKTHLRIHPMLHWREIDIWRYIKKERIPVVSLYFAREYNGKMMRFRSIGCEPCVVPIPSNAKTIDEIIEELETTKIAERSGRAQDKEKAYMMAKLRSLGYM